MRANAENPKSRREVKSPFPNHHRWDRNYHLVWVLAAWAAIIAGFGPGFYRRFSDSGAAPEPLVLKIHASVFTAWLVLISLQIGLVRWKNIKAHMRLGMLAVPLGIGVVLAGVAMAAHAARAGFDQSHDLAALQGFFHQLMDMTVFGAFFAAAIITRKSAATHKRLIVLATTFLLGAGFSRAIGPWYGPWWDDPSDAKRILGYLVVAYGGINLLMAAAALYDLVTRGRVHPANVWGIAIILCCEAIAVRVVLYVPAWGHVAHRLLYWN